MKNGYDQFFKKARLNAANPARPARSHKPSESLNFHSLSEKEIESQLRKKMGIKAKPKRRSKTSWKMIGLSSFGLIVAAVGFNYFEQIEKYMSRVEVSLLGSARAEEKPGSSAPAPGPAPASVVPEASQTETVELKEEIEHLSKLRDKKKELDAREEELNRMEAEFQKQKEDLEKRLEELRSTRQQISKMLEDRVKTDEAKVETLVQMYSNMRPPQAAKVFETLDEDLVIDIISRMKKKNAADIMNLLKPEKAQIFSEKFAGYKRK